DYPLIGVRWKCSNVCSLDTLTDRGLDLISLFTSDYAAFFVSLVIVFKKIILFKKRKLVSIR
ncbi:hypothetical protein, partial [Okeania sp. SIO2B9]|uniref:hypothetical protein n=1 Tax=Okeania sp. SIO2B9 TaxID=2607782 RepID=UPI00257ABEA6